MEDILATDEALRTATLLQRSALNLSRRLRDARRTNSLSITRLIVLGLLRREGPSSPSAIAERLKIQPQSLTRLLGDLETRTLVSRSADPLDRRRNLVQLTDAGSNALTNDVDERRTRLAEAIVRELTPTERELVCLVAGLMDRLATALPPQDGDTP